MKYEFFCGGGNPLTFTEATVYAPLILISILYLPTMIYIIFISIRFYGFKKWISEIINEPVYFIFPILTSLSFYGNSAESNFQENHVQNEQPLVLQKLSTNKFQKVDTPEDQRDMKDNDKHGNGTLKVTHISQKVDTPEQHGDMEDNDVNGIETIEVTYISPNNSQKVDTTEQHRDREDNDENGIETIEVAYISQNNPQKVDTTEQHVGMDDNDEKGIETIEVNVDTKNEITTACKRIRGNVNKQSSIYRVSEA